LICCLRGGKYSRYIWIKYNYDRFLVELMCKAIGLRLAVVKIVMFAQFIPFSCSFIVLFFHSLYGITMIPSLVVTLSLNLQSTDHDRGLAGADVLHLSPGA